MALSEHEQRILEELESQLHQEDPRLARRVADLDEPRRPRDLALAAVVFAVGFVLLLLLTFHPAFGVVGAAVMLVGLVRAARVASTLAKEQATARERSARE